MARIEKLVDDLTGADGAETHTFSLDGDSFEIDLVAANANGLRKAMAQYIKVARVVKGQTKRRHPKRTITAKAQAVVTPVNPRTDRNNAIREWARTQGHTVSDRGRIPRDLIDAYDTAHELASA